MTWPRRTAPPARRKPGLDPPSHERVLDALRSRRPTGRRTRLIRRGIAIALVVAAGVTALSRPPTTPGGEPAVAVEADLPAGHVLAAADLVVVRRTDLPDGVLQTAESATGRTLSAQMRRGELLTDARVVALDGPRAGPGQVATPVRLADDDAVTLLRPGMHVRIIGLGADDTGRELAADAVVLSVRGPQPSSPTAGRQTSSVVFAVDEREAQAVAAHALSGDVTFTFR